MSTFLNLFRQIAKQVKDDNVPVMTFVEKTESGLWGRMESEAMKVILAGVINGGTVVFDASADEQAITQGLFNAISNALTRRAINENRPGRLTHLVLPPGFTGYKPPMGVALSFMSPDEYATAKKIYLNDLSGFLAGNDKNFIVGLDLTNRPLVMSVATSILRDGDNYVIGAGFVSKDNTKLVIGSF